MLPPTQEPTRIIDRICCLARFISDRLGLFWRFGRTGRLARQAPRYSERVVPVLLFALVAGSLVYCMLTVIAAVRYSLVRPSKPPALPPISILKPLSGIDLGLEANLWNFFQQSYPEYEILFAVRSPEDPAMAVAERVRAAFPAVPSRLIVTGEPPYPNAKVFSLDCMLAAARYDLLVMADSDVRVTPGRPRSPNRRSRATRHRAQREAGFFPGIAVEVLAASIRSYQALGCWDGGVEIPRDLYEQSLNVFEAAGEIKRRHPYGEVCAAS
jgi:hypothetical protein